MSAPKIIAQIILSTASIVGRAFIEAYKEAAVNAASQQARRGAAHHAKDTLSKATGITLEEACSILNVPKTATPSHVLERYHQLFKQNDPNTGGSFYLQSKICRAKERLDMHFSNSPNVSEAAAEASKRNATH